MSDKEFLKWPFLEARHADWAAEVEAWAVSSLPTLLRERDLVPNTRAIAKSMGDAGLLRHAAPADGRLEVRNLCIAREVLARHAGLADYVFAMQGLGTGPISLFGGPRLKEKVLPGVRAGTSLAAFALSEPEAGSDVASLATTATLGSDGHYRINGRKTWISNGGIAGSYVVFARTGEGPGAKGISAFYVPGDTPGIVVEDMLDITAPHPIATLRFDDVSVPAANLLGERGRGFGVAMATLDVFRTTVGAAALGFARKALDLTIQRATQRKLFGAPLFDQQMSQAAIADSSTDVDASALFVYRAAWLKDGGAPRVSREASQAKLFATEAAQRVADRCVQMHGGRGVIAGGEPEELYREVRALRVYEGASEIQRIVIARGERHIYESAASTAAV